MGFVFLVHHLRSRERFAMKYLPLPSAVQRERMLREAQAQARVRHRHVVRVIEQLDVGGDPATILELVDGSDLSEVLDGPPLAMDAAVDIFHQLVMAVGAMHAAGVIHRDLKPSNVLMFKRDGRWIAKVSDFGIAKLVSGDEEDSITTEGVALGSPAYMSPEQARSARDVGPRTDLFALGCILYELVCGRAAFGGTGAMGAMKAAREGRFEDSRRYAPHAPEWVHTAITRCLDPSEEGRIRSCKEILDLMGKEDTQADAEDTDVREGPGETVLYGERAGSHAPTVLYGQSAGSAVPPEPTSLLGSKLVLGVLALVVIALLVAVAVVLGQGGGGAEKDYVPLEDVLGGE